MERLLYVHKHDNGFPMKTARITLLISPQEKARIGRQAEALGISSSEFVRKAANLVEAEDIAALEEIRSLLPQFNAALDRMHDNFKAALETALRHEQEIERVRGREHRRAVLLELADPDLIAAASDLFAAHSKGTSAEAGGTVDEQPEHPVQSEMLVTRAARAQVEDEDRPLHRGKSVSRKAGR